MNAKCVILITKNRPVTLVKTLHSLRNLKVTLVLIDDSTTKETHEMIFEKYGSNNITYHDSSEQKSLLKQVNIPELELYIRPLGTQGWNLGFIRNYALIVVKALGFKQALFMDDDIVVHDLELIDQIFCRLNSCDFVGARISGMADDSVVGHLMRRCGGEFYEFLAGGFLALNVKSVTEYFLNYYNEDQIWLFLHRPTTRFEFCGEVEQFQYDPFDNAPNKAVAQEFGEILEEGVEEAFRRTDHALLLQEVFWQEICHARLNYINQLPKLSAGKNINPISLSVYRALTIVRSR